MNLIKLKCENCGAQLEVNKELDEIHCNYCGTKIWIDDESSKIKRLEAAKLVSRKNNFNQDIIERKELENIEYYEKFKKGKLKIVVIILLVLVLLFTIVAFKDGKPLSGIIGIIQILLLFIGWLNGMQIIKEKFKYMHLVLFIIALLLSIIFFSIY